MDAMRTLDGVFSSWKTIREMADDIDRSPAAVEKWKERKSIPSSAWPDVIKALKRKGKKVGAADLLSMNARSKKSPVTQPNNVGNAA